MTYSKPAIATLGCATRVIETLSKDGTTVTDAFTSESGLTGNVIAPPPAYDLDE
jgi:hypothetical protein